jgi:DNA polymerase III delta subunit
MELVDLMKKINDRDIPHFLVLFGEEQTILDIYVQNIVKCLDAKQLKRGAVADVVKQSGKKSLDKSIKIYTVVDDIKFLSAEDNWENIKKSMTKDYLILRYHTLDKRSSFVRKNKRDMVEFSHLSKDVLLQYIQRDLPRLSEKNAYTLIDYCNNDYGRILMEVDKIKQYQQSINVEDKYIDDCFNSLDEQGIFHKEIGDITFDLTNAVLAGYPDTAISVLDDAKRKGEPAMMIASLLYRGFRNMLAYQGLGANKKGAMERTGLTKGELYGVTKAVGGYNLQEVERNMLLCQKVECGIKLGLIDDDIALDYLVLACLL